MKLWAPAIAWAVVLFWLSHRPGSDLPTLFEGADKLAHFALYAPLGFLLARATGAPWAALSLAVLYGVSDEWHQSFVVGRSPSLADLAADAVGGGAGAWLWRLRRSPVAGGEAR